MARQKRKRIVSVDPGGTTGFVLAEIEKPYTFDELEVIESGTITTDAKAWREILIEWSMFAPDVMFIESVIMHGVLDVHKTGQIAVADRAAFWGYVQGMPVFWISPNERRTVKDLVEKPKGLRSPHTRDAFDLIIAGLLREGDTWTKGKP